MGLIGYGGERRFFCSRHSGHTGRKEHEKMKKKLITIAAAFVMSVLFMSTAAFTAFASPKYVRIKNDPVAVRESAGTSGRYIRRLHSGEYYAYLSQKKADNGVVWYRIKIGDNQTGWVTSAFSVLVDSAEVGRIRVEAELVNVRKGAGYQYGTIGTTPKGTVFDYFDSKKDDDDNTWYRIKYNAGKTGWIVGTYSKAVKKMPAADSTASVDIKGKKVQITVGPVNIRTSASTGSKKLGTTLGGKVYKGLASRKDAKNNVWYQIQYTSNQKGWVMAQFCKIVKDAALTQDDSAKEADAGAKQVQITESPVNVRASAGTGAKKLGRTSKGKKYTYLGAKKDAKNNVWYQIQYTQSQKGWVMAQFCQIVKNAAVTKQVEITVSPVNVRASAGTDARKMGTTSKGKRYTYLGDKKDAKNNVWYQIQYTKSQKGWVMAQFCRKV